MTTTTEGEPVTTTEPTPAEIADAYCATVRTNHTEQAVLAALTADATEDARMGSDRWEVIYELMDTAVEVGWPRPPEDDPGGKASDALWDLCDSEVIPLVYNRLACPWPAPELGDRHLPTGKHGILYVGDLRRMLEGVDDRTQIVLDADDGDFDNVTEVIIPSATYELSEYAAVTLMRGEPIDSRQF
jgi:hypothetical protein